jgi:hypothetical protein
MRFGEFLVSKGRLSPEHVGVALREQVRRRVPLGTLAVQTGVLDRAAVHRVLQAQSAGRPWRPFGEVAEDMGIVDRSQLERLLEEQRRRSPRLGGVLVEQRILDGGELDGLVAWHYRRAARH